MEENVHAVVRMLPYHPELDPIEFVWAKVKNKAAGENVANILLELKTTIDQKLSHRLLVNWKKFCDHVLKIDDYFEYDKAVDVKTDSLIITSNHSDTSDDETDEI